MQAEEIAIESGAENLFFCEAENGMKIIKVCLKKKMDPSFTMNMYGMLFFQPKLLEIVTRQSPTAVCLKMRTVPAQPPGRILSNWPSLFSDTLDTRQTLVTFVSI